MNGNRMSFNIWTKVGNLITNPYDTSFRDRIQSLLYGLSWWKEYLFWKDSFRYVIYLWCLIIGHKYYHALYEKHNGYYSMFCQRCSKTHNHVRTICQLKKKRQFF